MNHVVGEKYKISRRSGGGSFGEIYLGVNVQSGEEYASYFRIAVLMLAIDRIYSTFAPIRGVVDVLLNFLQCLPSKCENIELFLPKLESGKTKHLHPQLHYESKLCMILQGGRRTRILQA